MELQNPTKIPRSLEFVPMGISDLGRTVSAELKSSTGIGIYGAPRRGKTSLIMGMLTALADREGCVPSRGRQDPDRLGGRLLRHGQPCRCGHR